MTSQGQKNYVYSSPIAKSNLQTLVGKTIDARNFSLVSMSFDWTLTGTPTGNIKLFYSYDKINWINSVISNLDLAISGHGEFVVGNSGYPFYRIEINLLSGGVGDTIEMFLFMR